MRREPDSENVAVCRSKTCLGLSGLRFLSLRVSKLIFPWMSTIPRYNSRQTSRREKFDRAGWLILAALIAVAVAMRFYRLGDVPAGLHYDEAFNGLDALALADIPLTDWPIFFNDNYGREPLFIWLSGLAHAFFGPSIWTARFISALRASCLIPMSAAACAFATATVFSGTHVESDFSPLAATLFVLLETLLWAAAWRAWQRRPPAISWRLGRSQLLYLPTGSFAASHGGSPTPGPNTFVRVCLSFAGPWESCRIR